MKSSEQNKNSRSIFRFLLFPKKQIKYALFHFLLICISVSIVNFYSYAKYKELAQISQNNTTNLLLTEYVYSIIATTLFTMIAMGVLTFLLVIAFLHRFVGPILPILKHLDAILVGNYKHKTQSRPGDELNEVVEKLNSISQNLEDNNKTKAS